MAKKISKGPFWWKGPQDRKWHYGGRYALDPSLVGSECGKGIAFSRLVSDRDHYGIIHKMPPNVPYRCKKCQAKYLRRSDG